MAAVKEGNKAKTARRLIEVLEFFDEDHREATVMDIVRRYNRPQSSTSELLASLVELGLLYKDPGSRSYRLTPRAAILGSVAQPEVVRDGRLSTLIARLNAQTGLGVALLGKVGLNAQIFRWSAGNKYVPKVCGDLWGGSLEQLTLSAGGQLLLSTVPPRQREGMLRRLNAEAPDDAKFNYADMVEHLNTLAEQGYAVGSAGFEGTGQTAAVLLPVEDNEPPMVLSVIFDPCDDIDPASLITTLLASVERCFAPFETSAPMPVSVFSAA